MSLSEIQRDRPSVEVVREVVAQLVREGDRLRVTDHLDDPNDSWIQIWGGPYKMGCDTERYIRLTIDVEHFEDDRTDPEELLDRLRRRVRHARNLP